MARRRHSGREPFPWGWFLGAAAILTPIAIAFFGANLDLTDYFGAGRRSEQSRVSIVRN